GGHHQHRPQEPLDPAVGQAEGRGRGSRRAAETRCRHEQRRVRNDQPGSAAEGEARRQRQGITRTTQGGERAMTKSQLIELLSARHSQLAPKDAELAVKTMLDAMSQTLASGNRIEIRGFGSFGLNYRPPRTGRNPKTGEKVQVPRKYVPHFKAGKELRERVDYHEGRWQTSP